MKITVTKKPHCNSSAIFSDHILNIIFEHLKGNDRVSRDTLLFRSHGRQDSKFFLFPLDSEKTAALKQKIKGNACCHGEANHLCNQTQHLISNGHDVDIIINWARKLIIHPCSHSCPSPSSKCKCGWQLKKKVAVLIQRNRQCQRTPYRIIIWWSVTSQQKAVSGTVADIYDDFED